MITRVAKKPPMTHLEYEAHCHRLSGMMHHCYATRRRDHAAAPRVERIPGAWETAQGEYNSGYSELVQGADRNTIYYFSIPRTIRAQRPRNHRTDYRYDWDRDDRPSQSRFQED